MRLAFLFAAAASLFAGAAAACPDYDDCPRRDHHAHGGYGHDEHWSDEGRYRERGYWQDHGRYREHEERYVERGGYGHHDRCWDACGELSLPASFFFDGGGVGPIPDSGFIGGGGFAFADSFAFSRASASAFASARAHANVSVNVRVRPFFKPHHGGKGGKRH